MPPRSYYTSPRADDYLAFARASFPTEIEAAIKFTETTGRPYIVNENHLASYLGISSSIIRQILHRKRFHYRVFYLKKADGSSRAVQTPKTYLKVIQWWINDNILSTSDPADSVHGFRKGLSYITNAGVHVGAKHLLNVDIRRFFPSITEEMIVGVFRQMGYSYEGAAFIASLTSLDGSAPTGAPTSPLIGNLVLRDFDVMISKLAAGMNMKYTRYADDLTFSSQERIDEYVLREVASVVEQFGFQLNQKKTRFLGKGDRMEVTGIVINDRINLPIGWRNWARGYLHRVTLNPEQFVHCYSRVSGILGVLKSIDPVEEQRLTQQARNAVNAIRAANV